MSPPAGMNPPVWSDTGLQVPFAVGFDRWAERRTDNQWLGEQWANPDAQVVRVDSSRIATQGSGRDVRPDWRPASEVGRPPATDWVFVGIDWEGVVRFAMTAPVPADSGLTLRELGFATGFDADSRTAELVSSVAVLNWHETHQHCPRCGTHTRLVDAGWVRECPSDSSKHFPRVDPAVIMLVVDESDRALLARGSAWEAGWFSTLAGFVEPGESFEAAVKREVQEEVSVSVSRCHYRASQPWPFPSSLMVGFRAFADGAQVPVPDGVEIGDARWFSRQELVVAAEARHVLLPPRMSISRHLIEEWYGARLPNHWSRG